MNLLYILSDITFQYSNWFILLAVLLSGLYASGMYYKDNSFGELSANLNYRLGFLRFVAVLIICLLLLSPVIRSSISQSEQPIVVLAQDNSESIGRNMSEEQLKDYKENYKALKATLEQKYTLKEFSFGGTVKEGNNFDLRDKATNMSQFMQEMYDLFSNQNIGTIIWATDGIYNQGSNPLYL